MLSFKTMSRKKKILSIFLVTLAIGSLIAFWHFKISPTKIALYNFSSYQVSNIALSNTDRFIRFERVDVEHTDDLSGYDFILGNGMGLKATPEQREKIKVISRKVPTHFIMAFNPENYISTVGIHDLEKLQNYLDNGNRRNYQNMARYVRKYMDKKILFAKEPETPIESKKDVYFHLNEEVAFSNIHSYERYLKENNFYKEGAKKIAVIAGIHDPYSGDKQFLDSTIVSLQNAGFNVYPVASSFERIKFLNEIQPDAVVYFPHGRLLLNDPDDAVNWLKSHNVPFFTPITIAETEEEWKANSMGMFGGFMGQTVVLPELDGALYPYVLFTQHKNQKGLYIIRAIPERLANFTKIVNNYLRLKTKSNGEKKVAIYYFKSPGEGTLNAQGLEVTASLLNVLRRFKEEGYNVGNLPNSEKELDGMINKSGNVFDPNAKNTFEQFVAKGNPILVEADKYDSWLKNTLSPEMYKNVKKQDGDVHGGFMSVQKDGKDYIAVAGIRFGNITILPQPPAAVGEDDFKMTHGVKVIPPHAYLASYLWTQNELQPDALLHFGTHGSLEFTPGKQVALSHDDWPEILVGTIPHFYYYTIANVGETMMAKRRTYATIISYLSPAFQETKTREKYNTLQEEIRNYYKATENDKEQQSLKVKRTAVEMGIHRYLRLDSILTKPYTIDEIDKIDNFAEEIAEEKINGEYYTSGKVFPSEKINSTVLAMSADPVAYSLAALDKERGKITDEDIKRKVLFTQQYLNPAKLLVNQILNGKDVTEEFVEKTAGIQVEDLKKAHKILTEKSMMPDFSKGGDELSQSSKIPYFVKDTLSNWGYDVEKDFVPDEAINKLKEIWKRIPSFVQKKLDSKYGTIGEIISAIRENNKTKDPNEKKSAPQREVVTDKEKEKARAILDIEKTLTNVVAYKQALLNSPEMEMKALFNGLAGGYVSPASGGDAVANPNAVPSGHNTYAINAENTPSKDAWNTGVQLAKNTIAEYLKKHDGKYPDKVAYTFWSGEFIETKGVSIAQALYLLGVEPVWDNFDRVDNVRLIPSAELGRPRIDVVIQTSGQFRDLAASRMFLISKAIEMASNAGDEKFDNHVKSGTVNMEKELVKKGVAPNMARELSKRRIFGGLEGAYGTGIQEYILAGDRWENNGDIASVYLNNMGASYDDDKEWGDFQKDVFRAALANTDVLIHPRQNNTWGALSLDHVYEFMGGMNTAIKEVTGKDPDAYLADYRNHHNMRMQDLKEAIGVEAQSTIFNPAFIKEMMKGSASSAGQLQDITTNMYGWNATRSEVIDGAMWSELYDTYVEDKYHLGVRAFYDKTYPAAMLNATAVMLETARKGMWKASPEQVNNLARLHLELTNLAGAASSSFVLNNESLQNYISEQLPQQEAKMFKENIRDAKEGLTKEISADNAKVLKKEQLNPELAKEKINLKSGWLAGGALLIFVVLIFGLYRKRKMKGN